MKTTGTKKVYDFQKRSLACVSEIGASGGVKCKGGKRANLYLDAASAVRRKLWK